MAKIYKEDQSGLNLGEGILHPILQHQWILRFNWANSTINGDNLSKQTVKCTVDYINNCIAVEAEENAKSEVGEILQELSKADGLICNIDAVDGNGDIYFTNQFHGSTIEAHKVEYDYSQRGVVVHKFRISFNEMVIMEPKEE